MRYQNVRKKFNNLYKENLFFDVLIKSMYKRKCGVARLKSDKSISHFLKSSTWELQITLGIEAPQVFSVENIF